MVGKGLAAGAVGTAVMTLSSTVEMKLRDREASSAPANAAAKVLGIQPKGKEEKARFAQGVHWAYGTSWGAVRGVIGALGLTGPLAAVTHFGAVWGNELVMLPALDVAPPLREWGATELGVDAFHHGVYAIATSIAFELLDRHSGPRT
ncbi:MAG: hypothetical protein H0W70_03110 [Actinobacteria bacterium]|nr:hypothetical protein [Actinomycetota bacterium]